VAQGLNRVDADIVGAGDIAVVAGFEEITIGETLTDANDPRPLPLVIVDEPSLGVTIGVNTSPLAGKSGSKLTARQIKARLSQELIGNMAIKVLDRETPDTWEVQGRGEMQLAVLVESMRREGFELTVGKPQVVIKEIDGKRHEPIEHVSIDVPEDYLGVVTQLFALRKGRMEQMVNHGTGWVRLEYAIPARGLIGIRTEFLTETRGTGIMHHVFDHYGEWAGEMKLRSSGALVADRHGAAAPYALFKLQERGAMFVEPTNEVYEGMIVGENARAEDMDVNVTKGKELSNMRSSGADDFIKLVPALRFGLDQALEFIQDDECIEVTPDIIRLRKNILAVSPRAKAARQNKASS
jgi:GTP-binding protein